MITEADETVDNFAVLDIARVRQGHLTADALVRELVGGPADVGHQVFDNIVEALKRVVARR